MAASLTLSRDKARTRVHTQRTQHIYGTPVSRQKMYLKCHCLAQRLVIAREVNRLPRQPPAGCAGKYTEGVCILCKWSEDLGFGESPAAVRLRRLPALPRECDFCPDQQAIVGQVGTCCDMRGLNRVVLPAFRLSSLCACHVSLPLCMNRWRRAKFSSTALLAHRARTP